MVLAPGTCRREGKVMNRATRRHFLKTGTAFSAALYASGSRLEAKPWVMPIGLQLYSVRELLPKDFDGTLQALHAAGYTEVEAAGYFNRTASEFRASMDRAGLRCVSTHHPLQDLLDRLDELIAYAHQLGIEYMICPWPRRRDPRAAGPLDLEDWRWVADELNRIGETVNAAGMRFGYHNHGPEFSEEKGVVYFDELMKRTDSRLVLFELDCGWVYAAGRNPIDYLAAVPQRFPLLHVKDVVRVKGGEYESTVLGRGVADIRAILHAATALKHYFIEQESFDMDPLEALRLDAKFMRDLQL